MSDFWKKILEQILPIVIKILEKLLDIDIDGDNKNGFWTIQKVR